MEVKKLNVEKIKQELKTNTAQKIVLGGTVVLATGLGFVFGRKYEDYLIGLGLEACFLKDPTLKEHLITATQMVINENE